MPTQKLVQNNFTSGQYDRAVQGKEQSVLVANGLAKAMNVLSSDAGELRKRLGTRHLMEIGESAVIVPFRLPDADDILLMFTDSSVKAYQFNGENLAEYLIPDNNAPTFPTTGWSGKTNGDYTVSLSSDSPESGWGRGFNAASSPYYNKGSLFTTVQTVLNIPAYIGIQSTNPQILDSLYVRWVNTCGGYHTGHYKGWYNPVLQYSDDGSTWVSVETDCVNPYSSGQYGSQAIYQASHHYGIGGAERTENYTLFKVINVNHNVAHRYWRIWCMDKIHNTETYSGERLEVFVSHVTYVSSTRIPFEQTTSITGDLLKDIKYSQENTQMMVVAKDVKPLQFDYSANGLVMTTFTAIDSFGMPASVSYFQNRLWFGGIGGFPTSVIGSKFGDYDVYTSSSPVAYDDYLNLKCNELKSRITNIMGSQNVLYCFSEDGISFVDGGSTGILATNQNVEFHLKNRMPAGEATPTFKDDVLLYGSSDGTKLYAIDYDLLVSRCQVDDLAKYAKDVVFDKITELHYINNESKLVYGLMENNQMFSLLYKKGEYQGFFPISIQNGFIYDICPIKRGRDYFLLMVTNRSGRWYLEEKLDKGEYKNTEDLSLTSEDKKWATYDNLENNIALDCYKTYDQKIMVSGSVTTNRIVVDTAIDLTPYLGQTLLLGQINNSEVLTLVNLISKVNNTTYNIEVIYKRSSDDLFDVIYPEFNRFPIALPVNTEVGVISEGKYLGEFSGDEIIVQESLYGWRSGQDVVYTMSATPAVNDQLYNSDKTEVTQYYQNIVASYNSGSNQIEVNADLQEEIRDTLYCWGLSSDKIYTLSETPSVGDQVYNADGTPATRFEDNTVYNFDGHNIMVVIAYIPYPATYAWTGSAGTVYATTGDSTIGHTITLTNNIELEIQGRADSVVYNGETYYRNTSIDGTYSIPSHSTPTSWYMVGYGDYLVIEAEINNYSSTASIFRRKSSTSAERLTGSCTVNYTSYIYYNDNEYMRNTASDRPAGRTIQARAYTRNSNADIQDEPVYTIIKKTFSRDTSLDQVNAGVFIDLLEPVHKVTYGATYDSYAVIKIQKPYESLKTVQQINLSVIDTMHLSIGTSYDDMQVIENINDESHYDLTPITMNGVYKIVPSDTSEWNKHIIIKSDKGLPFTVTAVEAIVNYSNEGGY